MMGQSQPLFETRQLANNNMTTTTTTNEGPLNKLQMMGQSQPLLFGTHQLANNNIATTTTTTNNHTSYEGPVS